MNSKILLTNYPRINQCAEFEAVSTSTKQLRAVFGYDINVDCHAVTLQIASDLIAALLTYDKVYVEGSHISDIIQVFGSQYLKELLRLNLLQVIPDQTLNPAIINQDNACRVDFFPYPQGHCKVCDHIKTPLEIHKWSHIENDFTKRGFVGKDANAILYLIDENSVNIDEDEIIKRVNNETLIDLSNTSLLTQYGLVDPCMTKPIAVDFPKLIRIQELNKTGVLASTIGIDSIKTDGEISNLLALKTISEFGKSHLNGVDALNKIEYEKGFPNLGELFVNQVIGLDDILKLRDNFHGKIFRYWLQNTQYEEDLMRKEIMNSVQNILGSNASNMIRFGACSLVGIGGFVQGAIASSFDSFILEKISKGWHPNFFLDNKLKSMIDKCIASKEQAQKRELIQERFKGVGRNELCPCGSGKKFKKCHGKNL